MAATSPPHRVEIRMQGSTRLTSPDTSSPSEDILFGREGGVATVVLNRPRALNAFTLGMYRRFDPMLRAWEEDPMVRAVLVRGAGERAFCAGGDVRAVYEAGRGMWRPARSDLGVLLGRIRADPPRPPLSEAVSRDHRRHHDGRRGRGLGQRRLPDRDREDAAGNAGDRDRPVPRCRRDAVPEFVPRAYRAVSRIDRGAARPGRRTLLRLCDTFRAARARAGPRSRRSPVLRGATVPSARRPKRFWHRSTAIPA